MAEVKKVATRVSYGEALVELGNEHDDFVVLDADLAAATQTGKFKTAPTASSMWALPRAT